jgi:hypothetical protein
MQSVATMQWISEHIKGTECQSPLFNLPLSHCPYRCTTRSG